MNVVLSRTFLSNLIFKKLDILNRPYYVCEDIKNEVFESLTSLQKVKNIQSIVSGLNKKGTVRDKKTLYQFILDNGSDCEMQTKTEHDLNIVNNKIEKLADSLHIGSVMLSTQAIRDCVKDCKLNVLKNQVDSLISDIVSKTKIRIRTYSFTAVVSAAIQKKIRSDNMFKQYIVLESKCGNEQSIGFTVPYYLGLKTMESLCKIHSVSDIRDVKIIP